MSKELTVVITESPGKQGGEWFDRFGFAVDRAVLRREFPGVTLRDFESWSKSQNWSGLHV